MVFEMQFRGVSYVSITITSSIAVKAHILSRNRPNLKHLKPKGLCCLIAISASITDNVSWWNLFCDWIKTVQFTQYACIFTKAKIHVIFLCKGYIPFWKEASCYKDNEFGLFQTWSSGTLYLSIEFNMHTAVSDKVHFRQASYKWICYMQSWECYWNCNHWKELVCKHVYLDNWGIHNFVSGNCSRWSVHVHAKIFGLISCKVN